VVADPASDRRARQPGRRRRRLSAREALVNDRKVPCRPITDNATCGGSA